MAWLNGIPKAKRGELRFMLPPGFCWNELGQIEMDPDQRVGGAIRLVFEKFRMLVSARQVMLWAQNAALKLRSCDATQRYARSSGGLLPIVSRHVV